MAKKKVKIGIVGLGAIGTVHANAFKAVDGAELAALCDVDAARLKEKGEQFGVKACFEDYRELVKSDVDAVIVCVGNALHLPVAEAAFKAGKHALVEKPMAMNAAEAAKINAAAQKAGKVLQVGMVWRQDPNARVVREYVEKGLFGQVFHARAVMNRRRGIPGLGGWFTTKAVSGGGPLIDLGVHWLDATMWLCGWWDPKSVSAKTYDKFGKDMRNYRYVGMWAGPPKFDGVFDVEDFSTGFVRFKSGATLSFHITWASNSPEEAFVEIIGDKGGARLLDGKPLQIFTEHEGRIADIYPHYSGGGNRFEDQARIFTAACKGEGKPAATGAEGVAIMKVLDAIYASSAADSEIAVPG